MSRCGGSPTARSTPHHTRSIGTLEAPDDIVHAINRSAFLPLSIRVHHLTRAGSLPPHHADPFDRMLVAQARCEDMVLVSADPCVARYDVRLLPAG